MWCIPFYKNSRKGVYPLSLYDDHICNVLSQDSLDGADPTWCATLWKRCLQDDWVSIKPSPQTCAQLKVSVMRIKSHVEDDVWKACLHATYFQEIFSCKWFIPLFKNCLKWECNFHYRGKWHVRTSCKFGMEVEKYILLVPINKNGW
jgi:hypothetical protein